MEHEQGSSGTSKSLGVLYADLQGQTNLIFDGLLARKSQTDKIRRQLKVINTYQHILSMPLRIRKNIDSVPHSLFFVFIFL
jgi:hypothetical protein